MFCGIEFAATYRFYISVSGLPHGEKQKERALANCQGSIHKNKNRKGR